MAQNMLFWLSVLCVFENNFYSALVRWNIPECQTIASLLLRFSIWILRFFLTLQLMKEHRCGLVITLSVLIIFL